MSSEIRTLMVYPDVVFTIKRGVRQQYNTLDEAMAAIQSAGETPQIISSGQADDAPFTTALLIDFDSVLYNLYNDPNYIGYNNAMHELYGQLNAQPGATQQWVGPNVDIGEISPGVLATQLMPLSNTPNLRLSDNTNVSSSTTSDTTSSVDLASMSPWLIGGVAVGLLFMLFKGGKGGSISGSPGGRWL